MPRRKIIRTADFPYHVTARSNNKEWFYLPTEEVWDIMINSLRRIKEKEKIDIHQFVLMSNHYHMLISTPDANIDRIMFFFANYTTREIQKRSNRINHIFGNRYHWSIIMGNNYLFQVYKYIYLNPVRAKIVKQAQDYCFSTLNYLIQDQKIFPHSSYYSKSFKNFHTPPLKFELGSLALPQRDKSKIFDMKNFLTWLNEDFDNEQIFAIKNGLKKMEFDLVVDRKTRRPIVFKT